MTTDTSTADLVAVDGHRQWMALARDAYVRVGDAFAALDDDDWGRPTACEGWTVRDLAGHLVGAMRSAASLREFASQRREISARVKRTGENEVDVMTAVQLRRAADLAPDELVAELQALVDPAVRGRSRPPRPLRRLVRFPVEIGTIRERWDLDYLNGCILTRDAWLHRIDLADAVGTVPGLDRHDRAVVGDVAVEWARRHGRPVSLTLTGPAGGRLVAGAGGEELVLDAIDFCRILSGRSEPTHPLLEQQVPF